MGLYDNDAYDPYGSYGPSAAPAPTTLPATGGGGSQIPWAQGPAANHQSQVPDHTLHDAEGQPSFTPPRIDFQGMQDAIMRQQSPYLSMGAHGWLQDNHPQVASRLDAGLAAMANTTSGRTAAENIAGVARGVVGGRMQEQQHGIQQAELPYQMAGQQLAYQQSIANLGKTQAESNRDNAMSDYYGTHGDYLTGRLGQLGNQTGNAIIDDNGQPWSQGKNGQGLVYAGNVPGYETTTPTFTHPHGQPSGQSLTSLYASAANPNDPNQAQSQATLNKKVQTETAATGGKKTATDAAADPAERAKKFENDEISAQVAGLGKPPSKDDVASDTTAALMNGKSLDSVKPLTQRKQEYDQKVSDLKKRAANYVKSGDSKKNIGFDPSKYGDQPTAQAAPAAQGNDLGSALDQIFPRQQ